MQGRHVDAASELAYDDRKLLSARGYLQACVAAKSLADAGVSFVSGQPLSYYKLLLQTQRSVEVGRGGKHYQEALAKLTEADSVKLMMKRCVRPALPAPDLSKRPRVEDALLECCWGQRSRGCEARGARGGG